MGTYEGQITEYTFSKLQFIKRIYLFVGRFLYQGSITIYE